MKKQTKLGLVLAAAAVISVSVASLVSAKGWVQKGADWFYVDNDGEAITDTIQSSGTAKFYLGADDGAMQKDFFLEDKDGQSYYFGSNGAMVTNTWVAIESSRVDNQGDYVPDNYWYYFQASGKAMKGTSGSPKKTTIDGKKYLFNEYGQMLTGWIEGDGKIISPDDTDNPYEDAVYFAGGDNDGVLRAGWVTYYDGYSGDDEWMNDKTNLYFYFNPTNNKKIGFDAGDKTAKTKKINGKTYAFADTGVMLSGWDVEYGVGGSQDITSLQKKTVYFSGEDDGHQVKKGWIYAVPASTIDADAYDDGEEKYMYFLSSGDAVRDSMKKINGKYYVFNSTGIMKTGLVIWAPSLTDTKGTHYVNTIDTDWATGEEYSKRGVLRYDSDSTDFFTVYPDGTFYSGKDKDGNKAAKAPTGVAKVKMHYFGDDGARKTGTNSIEFSDDTFQICTNASGDKGSGAFSKKYYSLGILLKASQDIKYGIFAQDAATTGGWFASQKDSYTKYLGKAKTGYLVLTTSGSKQKGATTAKKDADGNYWYINKENSDCLMGIWTVNVKYNSKGSFTLKEKMPVGDVKPSDVKPANILTWINKQGVFDASYNAAKVGAGNLECTNVDGDGNATIKVTKGAYYYQTDYNSSSNKWIPFGWYDDAGKTCYMRSSAGAPTGALTSDYYEVEPTNDYFLNCYWAN